MKVLLTGGGTGGHIYPALAVARRLQEVETDLELLYVGTSRGLESKIVPQEGIPFQSVEIEGFKRKLNFAGIKYNIRSVGLFMKSIFAAKKIIREFQPDIVLGTGGYVSAPICYAASRAGIPTVVHEQNNFLGLTNKFLLPFVDKLAISFHDIYEQVDKYSDKIVFTGNPRGQELVAAKSNEKPEMYGLDPNKKTVLILGGSRGAEKINQAVVAAYPELIKKDYQVVLATGEIHYEKITAQLNAISPLIKHPQLVIKAYIHEMDAILHHTSLLVSRSGATTIAEITALGLPSVLIPSPYVTDDHQTKNAKSLVDNGAALLLKEQELDGQSLLSKLDYLLNDQERLEKMACAAKELGEPLATDHLIQLMLNQLKDKM